MSNKPGRNDPCRCGSGKKYKRCCLPADEAAARERAVPPLFEDVFGDDDFDADDEIEECAPIIDVAALIRVCYTRGFMSKLSDLRSGRGVRVTEWDAPHIPQAVLDSIEREGIDILEGKWGDPKSGDPIQVDVIDLETVTAVVSVEVFNRAIAMVHGDDEEIRRIHRMCGVLEAAAADEADQSAEQRAGATTLTIVRSDEPPRPSARVDISDVLKEHRHQGGTCALCGEAVTRARAQKHLAACAPIHSVADGTEQRLIHIRATAPGLAAYWLDLEIKSAAKLEALDSFLRRIWLECCGHLSVFGIGAVNYFSRGYDVGFASAFGTAGRRPAERTMSVKLDDALPGPGGRFEYEYDFGSTTRLQLKVIDERIGRAGRPMLRLLARNTPPVWPCAICGEPATIVCTYCAQEDGDAFVCATHERQHACGEQEGLLPVVNSPRMGICGYTAQT